MDSSIYRAAVCLNNYGVSLLTRGGQTREAATVLRDAVAILHTALNTSAQKPVRPSISQSKFVSDRLHFATKCMAEYPKKTKASCPISDIHLVRYDGGYSSSEDEATWYHHHQYKSVIMIEDFDSRRDEDDTSARATLDIHTAIIVHNTAMARVCLSLSQTNEPVRKRGSTSRSTLKPCVRLLRWSLAILSRAYQVCPRESTRLSVFVLGTLSGILEGAEATKAARELQSMKDTVKALDAMIPSQQRVAPAA